MTLNKKEKFIIDWKLPPVIADWKEDCLLSVLLSTSSIQKISYSMNIVAKVILVIILCLCMYVFEFFLGLLVLNFLNKILKATMNERKKSIFWLFKSLLNIVNSVGFCAMKYFVRFFLFLFFFFCWVRPGSFLNTKESFDSSSRREF